MRKIAEFFFCNGSEIEVQLTWTNTLLVHSDRRDWIWIEVDTQPPATPPPREKNTGDLGWNIHFISDPPIYGDLIKKKQQQQQQQQQTKDR